MGDFANDDIDFTEEETDQYPLEDEDIIIDDDEDLCWDSDDENLIDDYSSFDE